MSGRSYEKILTGAGEFCFRHGLDRLKMDDLALYVGVSKKTLYNHFSSKDEIIAEVIRRSQEKVDRELQEILEKNPDIIACFRTLVVYGMVEMEAFNRFFGGNMESLQSQKTEKKIYKMLKKHITLLLEEGISQGIVKKETDREVLPDLILSVITSSITQYNQNLKEIPSRELFRRSLGLLFQGALTAEGNRIYRGFGAS